MKTKNILLLVLLLMLSLCVRKAEAQASISLNPVFTPSVYIPCAVNVNVSSDLTDGATFSAGSLDLPINESIKFNFAFEPSTPQHKFWDEWFVPSNVNTLDQTILMWGGINYGADQNDDYGQRWFPQQLGTVTVAYQVAWHDMTPGAFGIDRYVDKAADAHVETIQITINVVPAKN